ncbi:MAG: mechanosensitive ion channel family protein [Candidatus Limousia pullorum]
MFYGILRDLVESTTSATQAATAAAETTEDVTISVEEIVEQVTNDPATFFDGVLQWLKSIAGNLVGAALIIIIGFWISKKIVKIIKKGMLKAKNDYTVITFIGSVVNIILKFIIIISALAVLGVDITSILTAFGAAMVAIGLALQNSLSNIASGVLIILNKPFKAGDILEFQGMTGTVVKIDLFNTHMKTYDNREIIVPNSIMTGDSVINCTSQDKRRVDLKFSISYDDDILKVKGLLYTLIANYDLVMKDPEPAVYVGSHADSAIIIEVKLWTDPVNYWKVYYYMMENVKLLFDKEGITIPFPQVVVHNAEEEKEKKN